MSEVTLVALRVIEDHVNSVGGRAECVSITPQFLTSAASARLKYQRYLDEERRKDTVAQRGERRKAAVEELEELRAKRKRTQASVDAMLKSADQYADEAEKTGQIALISKSTAMRRAAKEKVAEIKALDESMSAKEQVIKDMSADTASHWV